MKISTKGRYGLRCMVDLAVNSSSEHVSVKSIAERQGISENYLEQVFSSLRKAGLVKSIKGSQGGYMLNGDPGEIRVSHILNALEGKLEVVSSSGESEINKTEQIISKLVWDKINEEINNIVESITLETLAQEYRKLNQKETYMFYI